MNGKRDGSECPGGARNARSHRSRRVALREGLELFLMSLVKTPRKEPASGPLPHITEREYGSSDRTKEREDEHALLGLLITQAVSPRRRHHEHLLEVACMYILGERRD
jgi:hypothetical protein